MNKKKILIIASLSNSLIRFREDFIKRLIEEGFEIYTASPDLTPEVKKNITGLGATPVEFNVQRTGLNPIKDFNSVRELIAIIKEYKIDLVFPYTVKPVIYGSIAANRCGIPVISLITGLGYTFTGISAKAKLLQVLNEILYKIAIRKNKVIVFQNEDDYNLFLERKILTDKQQTAIVGGSGVNLNQFRFREKKEKTQVSFLLTARLIKEKGIEIYIKAAKILKEKYPEAEFHIIGSPETSPSAISENDLKLLHKQKIIIFHGRQLNVEDHLHKTDVFVLPSYYREGVPRTLLEACSCGNPIITTDSVGCREAVREGVNGFLIEPKNTEALVKAMEYFIIHPHRIKEMGLASRKYAEERFDVNIINRDLLQLINSVIKN